MRPTSRLLVYSLFFASGATALVYQVVWVRQLTLIFGASFEAISIVLGSFMAGLALGGVVFGRIAERIDRPLRLYGLLEVGVAVFALALPVLLELINAAYVGAARQFDGVNWFVTLLRVVMAFGVLVLPTFFMGGTLPVLVKHLVARRGDLAERLSGLYAINTFGAVVGTLAAGFLLLRFLGVWNSTLVAVAGNVLIGTVAIVADRGATDRLRLRETDDATPQAARGSSAPPLVRSDSAALALRLAFWGTAVAGAGALALEVMWARAIAVAIGSTTYSYTIMLAAFLVGIALGSSLHGLFPLKRVGESVQFGATLVVIGITSAIVSMIIPRLPELAVRLNVHFYGGFYGIRLWTTLLLSFLVMLVPCIFMGVAFPLAGQARARLKHRYGESVGDLVAFNTIGAIAGSMTAGFVLIPLVGLQKGMLIASALYLGYGLIGLCARLAVSAPSWRTAGAVAGAGSIAVAAAVPFIVPPWDIRLLAAFQNNNTRLFVDRDGHFDMSGWLEQTYLRYYKEGRGSNVSVIESEGQRSILINGKSVATDSVGDLHHEYLLGHLPTLLHPDPKSAVVIGLGAGITLGGVAAEEGLERIVLVEIEPAVLDGARVFADLHDHALQDPRVEIVFQDGRNYLLTTGDTFDVITADPIHPWAQGAAYLYTTEYYGMIARHLNAGGIMCQWLPLYEIEEAHLRCVVATFAENFPYATVWQAIGDVILIGSNRPIEVDLGALEVRLRQPRIARQLDRIGLDHSLSLLASFTLDDAATRQFGEGARINTDDNLYLEFSTPLTIGRSVSAQNIMLIDSQRQSAVAVVDEIGPRFQTREQVADMLGRYAESKSQALLAGIELDTAIGQGREDLFDAAANRCAEALRRTPGYGYARHLLASILTDHGLTLASQGNRERGIEQFLRALAVDPGHAFANQQIGLAYLRGARYDRAIEHLERALERRPYFPEAEAFLGVCLAHSGRCPEAIDQLERIARLRPNRKFIHLALAKCFEELAQFDDAVDSLEKAAALDPDDADVRRDLARLRGKKETKRQRDRETE